ncbi:MAG: DUF1311 domain-containing protein [Proteobacteria bacterium]|nr:MAG: DUF1311 domain-containing protein [Pseudomonadota bacterium]
MKILMSALSAIAFTTALMSTDSKAASFDCKKAKSYVERKICKVPELSKLDDELAVHYKEQLAKVEGPEADELIQSQRLWIVERETCSSVKAAKDKNQDSFKDCLIKSFEHRQKVLISDASLTTTSSSQALLTQTYSSEELKFKFSYPSSMRPVLGTSVAATLSNEDWSEFYRMSDPKSTTGTLLLILDTGTRAALRIGYRAGNSIENACGNHTKENSLAANGTGFDKKMIAGQEYYVTSFGDAGMQKYMNGFHFQTFHKDRCLTFEKTIRGVNCSAYEEGKERQDCESSEVKSKAAFEELSQVIQSIELMK